MSCTQIHFDVAIVDNSTLPVEEPQQVVLTKTHAVHLINQDPCTVALDICVQRIVECQKGCAFDVFYHDFPIDPCEPILPPGKYLISVPEMQVGVEGSLVAGLDVIFEEVSNEYVQAIIANKSGGC